MEILNTTGIRLFQSIGVVTAAKWTTKRLTAKINRFSEMLDGDPAKVIKEEDAEIREGLVALAHEIIDANETGVGIVVTVGPKTQKPAPAKKTTAKKKTAKKKAAKKAPAKKAAEKEQPELSFAEQAAADARNAEVKKTTAKKTAKKKTARKKATTKATTPAPPKPEPGVKKKTTKAAAKADKPAAKADKPAAKADKPAKKAAPSKGVRAGKTRSYVAGHIIGRLVEKGYDLENGITQEMVDELDGEYGKANTPESLFKLRHAWHAIRGYLGK